MLDKVKKIIMILGVICFTLTLSSEANAFLGLSSKSDELKEVEKKLEKEKQAQKEFSKKAKSIKQEISDVSKKLVRNAKTVQDLEEDLLEMERKLEKLQREQIETAERLGIKKEQMIKVISALQNLAWKPSEALIAQPTNPIDTVRSAIILRETLPNIEVRAHNLRDKLKQLTRLKKSIKYQLAKIKKSKISLNASQSDLKKLAKKKLALRKKLEKKSENAKKNARKLASQAGDIKELLIKLAEEQKRAEEKRLAELKKKEEAKKLMEEKRLKELKEQGVKTASLIKHKPTKPEVKTVISYNFKKAKGKLPLPARGKIVKKYGETLKHKAHAKGITIQTRKNAQVVAPFDGNVLYAGDFRGYGKVIIIDHGDSYHSLIAGLEGVNVDVGQTLLAGEPIGLMTKNEINPNLYVELRKNTQPINPLPWFKH